jgi:hypothetical protein
MSARRRIASDGALSLTAGAADSSEAAALQPPPGDGAPPLALKSCMVSADEVRLGRLLGSGSQGQVHEASWRGRPVAVKVMADTFPRHMLGRKGSGDLGKMLEALEGTCLRPMMHCTAAEVAPCAEAPLPPGGRTPPEAQKLALLRELSTFTTWRVAREAASALLIGWL